MGKCDITLKFQTPCKSLGLPPLGGSPS